MFCDGFKCQKITIWVVDKSHIYNPIALWNLLNKEAKMGSVHFMIKWDWYTEKWGHIYWIETPEK